MTNDFSSKVERALARELANEQAAAVQRQQAAEKVATVAAARRSRFAEIDARVIERARYLNEQLRAQHERDRSHEGTLPETVWPGNAGELCRDFVAYVKERNFKGASKLQHRGRFRIWSIRGYGVGAIHSGQWTEGMQSGPNGETYVKYPSLGTTLAQNVFLCEDGRLRFYTCGVDGQFDRAEVEEPTGRYQGSSTLRLWHRHVENAVPDTITGLPIDSDGEIVVPKIGFFDGRQHVPEALLEQTATNLSLFHGSGDGSYELPKMPAHYLMSFQERPLETMLVGRAKAAA